MIFWRTIIFYTIMHIIFRIMGKREIGELSVLDLVVFIMMGELAVISIEQHDIPLMHGIIPILTLTFVQILLAFISLKSRKFRLFVEGEPAVIIRNGKIDEKMMKKLRYNFDDLLMQLRIKDVHNIADVKYAILETTGDLSVIKKNNASSSSSYTVPFILNGEIIEKNLQDFQKDKTWLLQQLEKRGYKDIQKISFCSYQDGEFFIDLEDE